jgi:hypothetical protein
MSKIRYTLFEPGTYLVNMIQEYPELRTITNINQCTEREIRFAWYYANPTSPYAELSDGDRLKKAAANVFDKKKNDAEYKAFINKKFPAHLIPVINFFKNNNLNARVRSKILAEKVFLDLETLINGFNPEDDEADTGNYVAQVKQSLDIMPKLIEIMEGSDGVKKKIVSVRSDEINIDDEPNIEDV